MNERKMNKREDGSRNKNNKEGYEVREGGKGEEKGEERTNRKN